MTGCRHTINTLIFRGYLDSNAFIIERFFKYRGINITLQSKFWRIIQDVDSHYEVVPKQLYYGQWTLIYNF